MEPTNFCYWLQGFFEINEPDKYNEYLNVPYYRKSDYGLNSEQVNIIRQHLNLVFHKRVLLNDVKDLILPTFRGSC